MEILIFYGNPNILSYSGQVFQNFLFLSSCSSSNPNQLQIVKTKVAPTTSDNISIKLDRQVIGHVRGGQPQPRAERQALVAGQAEEGDGRPRRPAAPPQPQPQPRPQPQPVRQPSFLRLLLARFLTASKIIS